MCARVEINMVRTGKVMGLRYILPILAISIMTLVLVVMRTGEGSLTITTCPVSGTVTIDGISQGAAPVTVTLPSGRHEITFSPYSDQYPAPGARVVTICKDEHTRMTGEYNNRFIPQNLPGGFSPADSLRIYGTRARPLGDGTIFDYIDGGGLAYLKYGLRETTHAVFRDGRDNMLTIDIFDMGSPENARSVFSDEEICPPGYEPCEAGTGCKAYRYEPDYLMYFHKARYLVFVSTTNDSLQHHVRTIGEHIAENIPEGTQQ